MSAALTWFLLVLVLGALAGGLSWYFWSKASPWNDDDWRSRWR